MNVRNLKDHFARMGARVMVEPARELWRAPQAAQLSVRSDHRGKFFHLMVDPLRLMSLDVPEFRSADDELELVVRQRAFGRMVEAPRQRFLCSRHGSALCVAELVEAPQN